MKYSKTVNVTSHDIIKGNLNRKYDVYTNRVVKNENDYFETNYASKDFACQYDSNRDAVICTCKRFKAEGYRYFNTSRQVYTSQRYTSARGFADVGVGSVKTLPRKRVRRIYLPDTEDRGVGSSDLTPFIRNTMEYNIPVINEKLSPIIKTKSGSTSPQRTSFKEKKNIDNHYIIPDSVLNIVMVKKHVRGEKLNKQGTTIPHETLTHNTNVDKNNDLLPLNIKSLPEVGVNEEKTFSSDSLLQHIHNLENTSSFKHSKTSIDSIIENKLEKEYLKKFLQISKQDKPIAEVHPVQDCSNESLQRRFEALRRGSIKKEVSVEHAIVNKSSSQNSTQSRKDVSISSDPPSLEARSYTDAKIYSPVPSTSYKYEDVPQISYGKSMPGKKRSSHLSTDIVDNDFQNVKGMFKLWEKKFNFEEDCYKKTSPHTTQDVTAKQKKKVELVLPKEEVIETQKKEGKKFSFFKRKNKERGKQSYKSKKGVTAGRCEVGDGLTIRIGAANEFTSELARSKYEQIPDDDLLRKAWLKRCLDNKNDSRNSVKIRWNNEMYATSSSTVFELMECIYKNTGILYTSRSEMTTSTVPATSAEETPYYHAENQQVNFMQQTIQAWMISKMMTDKSIEIQKLENKNDIEDSFSNQKWFIDKSKAFSQKIELVLHSKNFVKDNIRVANSSDYIVIDIPTGYFFETSSEDEQTQSSDEQVFNIVEYETAKSISYLNKIRNNRKMDISANENDIDVIVNVNQNEHKETNILKKEIEIPLLHRDVVVQGSNVYVPKRHDVVSVGIITQHTHNMDIQKPILRIQDEMTDDESTNTIPPQTKCKLAESYLQDYYRHWMPLGTDLYSWCSDSNLRASSDNNSLNSFNNQGDGSKSCPNIYDDYQASAIVSSCTTSSRSQCMIFEKSRADDTTTTYFNKLKKNKDKPQLAGAQGKRVLPKDSVEVFKRRKIYAVSKVKANWCADKGSEPLSKPSNLDKFAQKISNESICETKKKIKKHVSLKDFKKVGESIMSFKGSPGCKNCKTKEQCSKHALIMPEPMCEMVPPPCLDSCAKTMKPPCSKKGAPTCHVPAPPICPEGPPPPCQPACPPISPPCASFLEGNSPSPAILPPSSPSRSFSKLVPCSPPSSQQKVPLPSPHTLSPHLPPTAKPRPFMFKTKETPIFKKRFISLCIIGGSELSIASPFTTSSYKVLIAKFPRNTTLFMFKTKETTVFNEEFLSLCIIGGSEPSIASPFTTSSYKVLIAKFSRNTTLFMFKTKKTTVFNEEFLSLCIVGGSKPSIPSPFTTLSHKVLIAKFPTNTILKSSSPSASLPERSSPSPLPLFPPFNSSSPTRTKLSSQSSEQKPLCKDSFEKEKMPPHETTKVRCPCFPNPEGLTSLPKRHIHPTKSSPLTTPRDPTQVTQACGCNSQKSCGLPLCLSIKTSPSSSQEFPCPFKNQLSPNNSGISIKDSLSNKYIGIFKRLISKCSSLTTKKESGDCEYPRETKVKKKETSVPPISLIPPLPFCQPTSPKPRSHSKMSGVHLKKLPMPRNSSNERKPSCEVIKLNSKESLTIRMKPKTPSTEAIREDCNVKVVDEDGQTLYERREYKMDTVQARKHLVQDTYRDSQIHRVSTPNMDITNEKNVHLSEHKSKTSLSNIVEINLTIKLKQADKTTGVSIKRYDDTPKNSQNEKVNSQEFKDVYTLQDQSIDRIVDAEKRDVSIKIIINSYQQNLNKSKGKIKHPNLRADEEFSRKISEKFHTVSTGYSDVLDEQSYSVHRTTVNFTDYSDTSNHIIKPSEELVSEGLIEKDQINLTDIECETKHSKSEPSVTLVTVNKTEKEDGPALPSDISQVDDNVTNLENIFDTFNEKSATGISATDNEEALFSDFQHSDAKIPKLRNKEEKKKMLKFIFEDSMKSKNTPNKSKMKSIQKLLRAALTSDKSGSEDDSFNHEVAKELAYESLKPNFFKNSESMTNYYRINSSNSDNISSLNEIDEIFHPTEINKNVDSAKSINEESRCLCSHFAAKLNICEKNNFKACCCRGNAKRDEEIDCNLIEDLKTNEAKFVDVETQDSNLKEKEKKLGITIGSNTAVIKPREVKDNNNRKLFNKIPKRLFSYSSNDKACKSNRQTILGLSEDDKVIVLNSKPDDSNLQEFCTNSAKFNPIDILQLYETKKAVLDIYAEKTEFNETSEHLVAKLPRFICQTESGICNYEERFRFS
nr:uncharacterized protein LOC117994593 [Maniola hyperantus]